MEQLEQIALEAPKYRSIFFSKDVDSESVGEAIRQIVEINEHDEKLKVLYSVLYGIEYNPNPIKIYIDCTGGYVYSCFGLLSIIECSKTPIYTIATGAAMSSGLLILVCGHKRFAYELTTFLYHQTSSESLGTAKEMKDDATEIQRIQKIFEDVTIKKTKIPKSKLKNVYETKTDWYFSSAEAKRLCVIDKILKPGDEIE